LNNYSPSPEELRAFKDRHKISNQEVADKVGVSKKTVYRWMLEQDNDRYKHCPPTVWKLLKILYNED